MLTAACRTQTVSASRTAAERYSPKLVVCSKRADSKEAAAPHTAPVLRGAAAIRSVRSMSFAMTSSSSSARKMTSPWRRAFHSLRFIILFLYTLFWENLSVTAAVYGQACLRTTSQAPRASSPCRGASGEEMRLYGMPRPPLGRGGGSAPALTERLNIKRVLPKYTAM